MPAIKNKNRVLWNIKRALIERRMSAKDLAQKLGTSEMYLCHIIMGRESGATYRHKIAQILGYSEEWLFQVGDVSPNISQHKIGE